MSARHHQDVLPYPNQMRNTIGNYDWKKAMRFSMYGSLVVAPTLYAWVRFSVRVFPHQSIGSAVTKAAVEQVTYGPAATCLFFFGMTLLESQDWQLAKKEVADKFFTTYKVSEPPNNLSLFEKKIILLLPFPIPILRTDRSLLLALHTNLQFLLCTRTPSHHFAQLLQFTVDRFARIYEAIGARQANGTAC